MGSKGIRDTPEVTVYKGYDLEMVMDTDDDGYENGEPTLVEEVKLNYERDDAKE